MNRVEEIKAQIAELQKALKAAEQEAGRAKRGKAYWYLSATGGVLTEMEAGAIVDDKRFAMGNYYLTEEEAIKARDRQLAKMRVIRKMREIECEEGWVADWSDNFQYKHLLYVNHGGVARYDDGSNLVIVVERDLYTCEEAANYIAKNMADDVKLILGIE